MIFLMVVFALMVSVNVSSFNALKLGWESSGQLEISLLLAYQILVLILDMLLIYSCVFVVREVKKTHEKAWKNQLKESLNHRFLKTKRLKPQEEKA